MTRLEIYQNILKNTPKMPPRRAALLSILIQEDPVALGFLSPKYSHDDDIAHVIRTQREIRDAERVAR